VTGQRVERCPHRCIGSKAVQIVVATIESGEIVDYLTRLGLAARPLRRIVRQVDGISQRFNHGQCILLVVSGKP